VPSLSTQGLKQILYRMTVGINHLTTWS